MSKVTVEKWWFDLLPSEQFRLSEKHKTENILLIYEREFKFNLEEND